MSKPRLLRLAPGKVSFFCEHTRIHLTLANPIGELPKGVRPSLSILNSIKGESLIDVNRNIVGGEPVLEAETESEKDKKPVENSPKDEEITSDEEEIEDDSDSDEEEEDTQEAEKPKRRRNTRKKTSKSE